METLEDRRSRRMDVKATLIRIAIFYGGVVGFVWALASGDWRPLLLCVPLVMTWKHIRE